MKIRHFTSLGSVVVSLIFASHLFSPAIIIPPSIPLNPINIYLVDYGLHSRLILPTRGQCLEYAYGDWRYFALNQQDWLTGAAALFLPTQGALGRRFKNCDRLRQVASQSVQNDNKFSIIAVEKIKVERLLKLLNSSFDRTNNHVENYLTGMTLVPDDRTYTLLHNSNHELVRWLQDLGCRVEGFVLWANFKISNQ